MKSISVIILESKNLPIYSITTTTKDIAQSFQSMVCHLYLLDFKRRAIRSVESSLKIWEHIATRQKKMSLHCPSSSTIFFDSGKNIGIYQKLDNFRIIKSAERLRKSK